MGASKHWKDSLEQITGERDLDASAILDYFKPLYKYLKDKNEEELQDFLENDFEPKVSAMRNEATTADWDFATDVNNKTKEQAKVRIPVQTINASIIMSASFYR